MRLGILTAAIASLALTAAPAFGAGVSHSFSKTISGTGAEALSGPSDVAYDQANDAVWVTDPGNHRVEKFDATSGAFILMIGGGVDQTKGGNLCTDASGDTCGPGTAGSTPGSFQNPALLRVDNSGDASAGDVYVGDVGDSLLSKFDSSGNIIPSWNAAGTKLVGNLLGIDVDTSGHLYVYSGQVNEYSEDGKTLISSGFAGGGFFTQPGFGVDAAGNFFSIGSPGFFDYRIYESTPADGAFDSQGVLTSTYPTQGFAFDRATDDIYQSIGTEVDHYAAGCQPANGECDPVDTFGNGNLTNGYGVAVDPASGSVYIADSGANDVAVFGDVRPQITAEPASNVSDTSVTLNAHIDPAGRGDITACHFEYGFDTKYGKTVPCNPDPASNPPGSNFTGPTDVTADLTGLSPGTTDHYRVIVSNSAGGTAIGKDLTFRTTEAPAIDGLSSSNLTATTADLNAAVNPNGLETTYRFEYGPTTTYGQVLPVPDGTLNAAQTDQSISVHLENLTPHVVYHYRLIATNANGTTTTGDHTFNFYPQSCPNENVRQQTQANFLPDCRAYELVSPGNAGGTQLYSSGPNTGQATNPSRFSFSGLFSSIPSAGGSPLDTVGDLYVATRTDTGWVTKYVGLPADKAAIDGGPPMGLYGQGGPAFFGNAKSWSNANAGPDSIQNNVLTDPQMDTFLDWNVGAQDFGQQDPTPVASNAPYVWGADGSFLDRWPTNLGSVPDGAYPPGIIYHNVGSTTPLSVAPGGENALDCTSVGTSGFGNGGNYCPGGVSGGVTASSDLSHFIFATEWNVFAPGGQLGAPGSVYDNNTRTGSVVVASKTPAGDDIPSEPTDSSGDPLQIPAVSSDGSHILLYSGGTGPCGISHCPTPPCSTYFTSVQTCGTQPGHLYMRIDGSVTDDVSQGHDVSYVGMTDDGTKVYFTSPEQLTPDDHDSSVDLYMWSEATNALTRVSAGNNGTGNSDACTSSYTNSCNVTPFTSIQWCQQPSGQGGNCRSDNSIAADNGDIYFFSPEQLDGSSGIPNQQNLYDFRNGQVQYVTTLTTGQFCASDVLENVYCSTGPMLRMQVSPDDTHMAFLTASPVTQYDNAGHVEMYTYDPATKNVVCVSCVPSGAKPTSDAAASQDGLFMTDDGRAFFSTSDSLVKADTNKALDVYEYVDGRPQLITLGTGDTTQSRAGLIANSPGLVGVSADGRDVYFGEYQSLVPADENGLFLKFYDARAGGGFSAPAPPPPCAAADECHGDSTQPPPTLQNGTGAQLGNGGNIVSPAKSKTPKSHHKKAKKHRKRHHRRSARGNGGASR